MKLTKLQMVKDIFFLATTGQRTAENWVQGMSVIETVARYTYRDIIRMAWDKVDEAGDIATAKKQMRALATLAYFNVPMCYRDWFSADRRKFDF